MDRNYQMNVLLEMPVLAQAYVPMQEFKETFDSCTGLKMGTMFPELVRPYMPCQSMEDKEFVMTRNRYQGGWNNAC